jgi:hypothetical protein
MEGVEQMSLSSAVKCASAACLILTLFEMPDEFYKVLRFVVLAGAIFTVIGVQKSRLFQNWENWSDARLFDDRHRFQSLPLARNGT